MNSLPRKLTILVAISAVSVAIASLVSSNLGEQSTTAKPTPGGKTGEMADLAAAEELWLNKQWDSAVRQYKQIAAEKPGSHGAAAAHRRIGLYKKARGQFDGALEHLRSAVAGFEDARDAADATTSVACIHHFRGEYERSISELEAVLAQTTDWDQIKYCSYWIREAKRRRDCRERDGASPGTRCAAQALSVASAQLGVGISLEEVDLILGSEPEGDSMQRLIKAAEQCDFPPAFGVRLTLEELRRVSPPAILLMTPSHYVVLRSNQERMQLTNPIGGGRTEDMEWAETCHHLWTGYAVVFDIDGNSQFRDRSVGASVLRALKGRGCFCCPEGDLGGAEDNPHTRFDEDDSVGGCALGRGMPRLLVNTVNLNSVVQDVDLAYSGVGPPVVLQRTYNADSASEGIFGRSWICNYEMRVDENPAEDVYVRRPTGGTHTYRLRYDATYAPPEAVYDTLTKNDDGTWSLTEKGSKDVFRFDPSGRLTQIEDRNGNALSLQYAGDTLIAVVDAAGRQTLLVYDENGHVTVLQDPRGRTVVYGYNESGDLVSVTDMAGTTVTYDYDENAYMTGINTPNGTTTIDFTVGGEGYSLTAITDPLGNRKEYGTHETHYTVRILDGLGRATYYDNTHEGYTEGMQDDLGNEVQFGYDSDGNLSSITDALDGRTELDYDDRGNVVSITDPLDNAASLTYDDDDNLLFVTDPLGRTTGFEYDARANLTGIIDALSQQTLFAYDARGLLPSVTNPRGQSTQFAYDGSGNLTTVTDPLGRTSTYQYDAVGRVTSRTTPDGITVGTTYDGIDRVLGLQYPDGTVSLTYNCCQLTGVTGKNGRQMQFTYDETNRLTQVVEANGFTIGYEYDAAGQRTAIIYPGDKRVTYGYDEAGRLIAVTDWLGNITQYAYDAPGNLTTRWYPNGTTAMYEYDAVHRLVLLTNQGVPGQLLPDFRYTLDEVGNRTRIEYFNTAPVEPQTPETAYTYDAADQILSAGDTTFEHDQRGNLIREVSPEGVTTYAYDYDNMLTGVVTPEHTYNYGYDPLGHRIWREVDSQRELHIVDMNRGLWQVIAHANASGEITEYFIYGLGLISRIDADDNSYYYHYDGLGSAVGITDQTGGVVGRSAYGPFGRTALAEGADWNSLRYAGRYGIIAEENGLLFMRARYYSPEAGRFLNKDPIGFAAGLNRYRYVENNPLNLVDPLGLRSRSTEGFWPSLRKAFRFYINIVKGILTKNLSSLWEVRPEATKRTGKCVQKNLDKAWSLDPNVTDQERMDAIRKIGYDLYLRPFFGDRSQYE